jgi:hypothetical protein
MPDFRLAGYSPTWSGLVIRAASLNEFVALFPRADNHWFSRIRVANSLINSDFADFTALQAYTGSRSASRARRLKSLTNYRAPKQKDRRPRFPMIRFQARRLTRALKDRHDTGPKRREHQRQNV